MSTSGVIALMLIGSTAIFVVGQILVGIQAGVWP